MDQNITVNLARLAKSNYKLVLCALPRFLNTVLKNSRFTWQRIAFLNEINRFRTDFDMIRNSAW